MYALNAAGFETKGFEDGDVFWEALQREKPRLVLLDIMLPGTDGIIMSDTNGEMLAMIEAGFQPDMVTFTPDGTKILAQTRGNLETAMGRTFPIRLVPLL